MTNLEVNLKDFDFKFGFGLEHRDMGENFDVLNNPYVEIVGYQWDILSGLTHYIDLEMCSEEYAYELIKEQMRMYYPRPICFKDDELIVRSNYATSSNALHLGYWIRYCENTTENGNWCKSKQEIDDWVTQRSHAFLHQETRVNKDLWGDSPQFKGTEDYFPLIKTQKSDNWGPLEGLYEKREDGFNLGTIFFNKNKLTMDDQWLYPNVRETEFGNFINYRKMFIKYSAFDFMPDDEPQFVWKKDFKRTIFDQQITISNEYETHERMRVKFIASISDLGGLYALLVAIFAVIYWIFAEPFRDLHLALSYNQMKNQICRQEGLIAKTEEFDVEFEERLGLLFSIYLLLIKRLPVCFKSLCFWAKSVHKISFDQMIAHFDELVN